MNIPETLKIADHFLDPTWSLFDTTNDDSPYSVMPIAADRKTASSKTMSRFCEDCGRISARVYANRHECQSCHVRIVGAPYKKLKYGANSASKENCEV